MSLDLMDDMKWSTKLPLQALPFNHRNSISTPSLQAVDPVSLSGTDFS